MAITFFYIDDDDVQKASEKVQGFESSDLKISQKSIPIGWFQA